MTTTSSGPDIITVNFADGSQGRYLIKEQAAPLKAGEPIAMTRTGDTYTIFSPQAPQQQW